jgi:NADH:ubiquinone oxidoreductase subunit K
MIGKLFLILIIINLFSLCSIIFFQKHFILIIIYFEIIALLFAVSFIIIGKLTDELTYSYAIIILTVSTAETVLGLIISICAFSENKQVNITSYKKLKY